MFPACKTDLGTRFHDCEHWASQKQALAGSGLLGLLGRATSGALGATVSGTGAPGPRAPGTPTAEPVHGARQARLSLNSRKRQLSVDNLLAHGDAARPAR